MNRIGGAGFPRAEAYVLRDMTRKCGDDVSRIVRMTALLLDHPSDRTVVAFSGTAAALASTVAFFLVSIGEEITPEEAIDGIWEAVRPMAVKSAMALIAKGA